MGIQNIPSYNATSTSASGVIKASQGVCGGIICTASTAGTIKLWDNASAASGTVLVETMSVTAGQVYRFDIAFANGLYLTIGGTATVSVLWV